MQEVRSCLWIGDIRAITQLHHIYTGSPNHKDVHYNSYPARWTVITVLKDVQLLQFVRNTIAEYQNDTSKRFEVIEHIEWILPDTLGADFVSAKLLSILETMNKAIHVTNHSNTYNETKSNIDLATSRCSGGSEKPMQQKVANVSACLVHCAQGRSRSAAVIAAYLLYRRECMTIHAAIQTIRNVRPCVQPNIGFLAGLRAIEQCDGNITAAINRIKRCSTKEKEQTVSLTDNIPAKGI